MKKYIRSVVLICALNGVGVWAEAPCARTINSPEFGPWPAKSSGYGVYNMLMGADPGEYLPVILVANKCQRSRGYETCEGREPSIGWTGYYCYNGANRHHTERTQGRIGGKPESCPNVGATVEKDDDGPTKVLSMNRPCTYYNSWSW